MELRAREAQAQPAQPARDFRWVCYARISANLKKAVIVTEDGAFWQHEGVDYEQLRESIETNWERREFARGASTITQQLAKNLYLSPSKNPIRKLRELLITRRLELELSKQRILELYLNVDRVGRRHLGRGSGRAPLLPQVGGGADAAGVGPAGGGDRQSATSRPRAIRAAAAAAAADLMRRMGAVTPPPVVADPAAGAPRAGGDAVPRARKSGAPPAALPASPLASRRTRRQPPGSECNRSRGELGN